MFVPVIVIGAVIQAGTAASMATPAFSWWFSAMVAVSLASATCSLALTASTAAAHSNHPAHWPARAVWAAAALLVLATAWLAVLAPILVPFALLAGALLLTPIAATPADAAQRPWSGFHLFRARTAHAVALSLLTLAAIGALWLGALLLGLFVTGVVGAFAVWLIFGIAGTILLASWSGLLHEAPRKHENGTVRSTV